MNAHSTLSMDTMDDSDIQLRTFSSSSSRRSLGVDNKGLESVADSDEQDKQILRFSSLSREDHRVAKLAEQEYWLPRDARSQTLSGDTNDPLPHPLAGLRALLRSLKKDPQYVMAEIKRGHKGDLGFKIEGGTSTPCIPGDPGIFVQMVMPGGSSSGKLHPGDRILSVNGVNITRVSRKHAKHVIRKADSHVVRFYIKRATKRQQTVHNAMAFDNQEQASFFSKEQIEEFEDAFSVFNKDGTGQIKTTRVFSLIRTLGHNPPEHEVWVFLNELGLTANSKLSFQDFVKLMAVIVTDQNHEKEIAGACNVFDTDERGYITVEELKEAFERMPGRARLKDWEIKEIIKKADPAERGLIPTREFKNLLLPSITLY